MLKAKLGDSFLFSWVVAPIVLRSHSDNKKLICPRCNTPLIFVESEDRINHFRHHANIDCWAGGESNPIHDRMEMEMARSLESAGYVVDIEKTFKFGTHKRIADVYGKHPKTGHEIVIEVQYKHVNVDVLQKTKDFNSKKINIIWVFYDPEGKPKRDLLSYARSISSLCFLYNEEAEAIDFVRIFARHKRKQCIYEGSWQEDYNNFKWTIKGIVDSVPFSEFITYWKKIKGADQK